MLHFKEQQLLTLLELATVFVADKHDNRYYLHDVVYKDNRIVAANGHMLVKIDIKNNNIDDMPIILPERLLVKSIKDANKVMNMSLIVEGVANTNVPYPDIDRLIPQTFTMSNDVVGLNVTYIASAMTALHKAFKKLGGGKYMGCKLVQTSNSNGNFFECKIGDDVNVLICIMPMRL